MNVIDGENTGKKLIRCALLSVVAFFFGPFLLIPGFKRLKQLPPRDPNRTILKWTLLIGSAAYFLCALYLGYTIILQPLLSDRQPEFGEHAAGVPWLMQEASDVSYYRSFSYTAYEFAITEEHFRRALSRRPLQEITEPLTVHRYNRMHALPENETRVTIRSGLWTSESSARGRYVVAYDREKKRAYFQESPPGKE